MFYRVGVPQEERAQIDAVERRLAQKYAELPHDHVASVVQHADARFIESKLRDFVPLLVERRAGEELARSMAGQEAPRRGAPRQAPARWRFALSLIRR
jgi:hypothetical protein